MERLKFSVLGGNGDKYTVIFERTGDKLNAFCTCQAGQNGSYCNHRFALMDGDYDRLVSDNVGDLGKLQSMIKGTDLEKAYLAVVETREKYESAKTALKIAQAKLARAMHK